MLKNRRTLLIGCRNNLGRRAIHSHAPSELGGPLEHLDIVSAVSRGKNAGTRNAEVFTHLLEPRGLVYAIGRDVEPSGIADVVRHAMKAHFLNDLQESLGVVAGRDHHNTRHVEMHELVEVNLVRLMQVIDVGKRFGEVQGAVSVFNRERALGERRTNRGENAGRVERFDVLFAIAAIRECVFLEHNGAIAAHHILGADVELVDDGGGF